jgi:hypothetical protein
MEDGRTVEFPPSKRMTKELITEGACGVRFDFENGLTRTFFVPQSVEETARAHGYAQKLGDWLAGMKNEDKTGPAECDDMVLELEELHERIEKTGQWNAVREGGASGGGSLLLLAIMELKGLSRERVKALLAEKTNAEKALLRESKSLRPIIERLRTEKNTKAAEQGDSLLAEFA